MKSVLSVFLFLTFGLSTLFSQSAAKKMDSLMQVAETSNDSIKLRHYNRISFYYIFNEPERAKKLLVQGIALSQKKKIPFSEAELVNTYGIYYDVSGKSDSAKYYFERALSISKKNNYEIITVMVINNLGMFHWNKGNYQEALDYFFQALEINKSKLSKSAADTYYSNIGLIYQEMGLPEKALEYHNEALQIRRGIGNKKDVAISLNNIGVSLTLKKNYKEAEKSFLEAIKTAKEVNEFGILYSASNGLAELYILNGTHQKAIHILETSIKERDRLNIDRRSNLSAIANLIIAYSRNGQLNAAKNYIEKGNAFLVEFPELKVSAVDFYSAASQAYFRDKNYKEGNAYFEKTLAAKDSIFSTENAEKTADLETKFKVSENERNLAETRANLAETQLEVKQKNIFIFGAITAAIFLGILGFLVYRQQKLKNSQLQKESQLKTALAKIETQNELQEQRLRISRDLHDNIGSQLTFIISSIDNLKFGLEGAANNVTTKLGKISEFASQTIYELRDTIWAMNKTDISIEDLQVRISNFIEKARAASDVNFHFNVNKDVLIDAHFTSVEGMNIYRIIQEAVNNALKYAEPKNIELSIEKDAFPIEGTGGDIRKYRIKIYDDGKGFNLENSSFGNGIANIKKRANDLGGKVEIISKEGKGTTVELVF
ncbi:sensor histidine kinase [Aequorivita sp. SDUM287046]|uniref:histidine kinase n=1 Tax=Aequorivita aurantiaca TaxID=3053356 RepID=A0ABT8DHD5_9FLAO|nr:sensor histidine kinase [Aequorivita aurantiaca]MDN3724378.1 sensor histidine kinase [Aequorivita aurantiaca]